MKKLSVGGLLALCLLGCSAQDRGATGSTSLKEIAAERRADIVSGIDLDRHFSGNCTSDCSGHRAGYLWAMNRSLQDGSRCMNSSRSFREGCRLAVEDAAALAANGR
jgi:hypothetical protein